MRIRSGRFEKLRSGKSGEAKVVEVCRRRGCGLVELGYDPLILVTWHFCIFLLRFLLAACSAWSRRVVRSLLAQLAFTYLPQTNSLSAPAACAAEKREATIRHCGLRTTHSDKARCACIT
jgi:hypothetical protein